MRRHYAASLLASLTLACTVGDISVTSTSYEGGGPDTVLTSTGDGSTSTSCGSTETGADSEGPVGSGGGTGSSGSSESSTGECEPEIQSSGDARVCSCGLTLLDPEDCGCGPVGEQGCFCDDAPCGPCAPTGAGCICGAFLVPPERCPPE